jgi:hypothetical protein
MFIKANASSSQGIERGSLLSGTFCAPIVVPAFAGATPMDYRDS